MSDQVMTYEDFKLHEATDFKIVGAEPGFTLTLSEIALLRQYDAERRAPFSLVFKSPDLRLLEQGVYRLQHVTMGETDIFLVPIARHSDGMSYEAVFN